MKYKEAKKAVKEFLEQDVIYQTYLTENDSVEYDDFEKFCINNCNAIKRVLDEADKYQIREKHTPESVTKMNRAGLEKVFLELLHIDKVQKDDMNRYEDIIKYAISTLNIHIDYMRLILSMKYEDPRELKDYMYRAEDNFRSLRSSLETFLEKEDEN